MKPRLLDTYCGVGGSSEGYARAGFDVIGVDLHPQPNFPFRFIQGDAVDYIRQHGHEYDAIHASPPCQAYTWSNHKANRDNYPKLIAPTREALVASGRPYVLENVPDAKRELVDPVLLCGAMFGLRVIRHRLFEVNFPMDQPAHERHVGSVKTGEYVTVAGHWAGLDTYRRAMGISWAKDRHEVAEALPPAYTEYIGCVLRRVLLNWPEGRIVR
jgi:DNA (cytosine-5)-methyltransferase 1